MDTAPLSAVRVPHRREILRGVYQCNGDPLVETLLEAL